MDTITLQIGNSDNKLTQAQWSDFFGAVDEAVNRFAERVHFSGTAPGHAPRQNACWVFETAAAESLRSELVGIRRQFHQDSVAWTRGATEFL